MNRAATTLCALSAPLVLASCGAEARGNDTRTALPAPRQIIVALDMSGSQSADRLADARRALEMIIDDVSFGDRLVLLQVHRGAAAEDGAARWMETVPVPPAGRAMTSLDRERLDAVRQAARSVAQTMFARDSAGLLPTTDLFATLHIAAEYIRDGGSRRPTIIILSDMFQSAHGIEMSRADGMPSGDWIERQRSAGVLPRLDGACVSVIGADATTPQGIAVRDFWTLYLQTAGASLGQSDYRLLATAPAAVRCE